jgi:hypothetical protein
LHLAGSRGADETYAAASFPGLQKPRDFFHFLAISQTDVLVLGTCEHDKWDSTLDIEHSAEELFFRHRDSLDDVRIGASPAQRVGGTRHPTFDLDAAHNKLLSEKRLPLRF